MRRRPPVSTLFPYTTLFRSRTAHAKTAGSEPAARVARAVRPGCRSGRRRGVLACSRVQDEQRSEEHTSELQSRQYLVCRLLLEKKKASRDPTASRLESRTRP